MMMRIDWTAIEITAHDDAGFLQPLLIAVVAALAQRLMVCWVPKQRVINAAVSQARFADVVDHGCRTKNTTAPTVHAQRMRAQIAVAVNLPFVAIPALCSTAAIGRVHSLVMIRVYMG